MSDRITADEARQMVDEWVDHRAECSYAYGDALECDCGCSDAWRHLRAYIDQTEAEATVTCEDCGFRYGAEHLNTDGKTYTCPLCELQRAEAERDQYRDALTLIRGGSEDALGVHIAASVLGEFNPEDGDE